jgi:hypothetical protein
MELYNLHTLVINGFVYAEVQRGMYGLPQAAIIANKQLQKHLAPHGYGPVPITPGCGNMTRVRFPLHLLSMTSESNMSTKLMLSI